MSSSKWLRRGFMLLISASLLILSSPILGAATYYENQVAVLIYHHISDTEQSNVTITPDLFREQLGYLKDKGYRFIDMDTFQRYMKGEEVPDNAVLVTFDDSYKSIPDQALPILKELDIPAVNFYITQDLDGPFSTKLPTSTEADLSEMSSSKFDIQCHSNRQHRKHNGKDPFLTTNLTETGEPESVEQRAQRIEDDTKVCAQRITKATDKKVNAYAYPFGSYDSVVINSLKKAGIEYGFTVVHEMATREDDPMQIPRLGAGNPGITPQTLHNSIIRSVVDGSVRPEYIPLRDTFSQIGGVVIRDDAGTHLYYGKQESIVKDQTAIGPDGQTITLSHPLVKKNRSLYIHWDDFKAITGFDIIYNPNKGTYTIRRTPKSGA